MDLVLINSSDSFDGTVHVKDEVRVPLGIMSIAAFVEQSGFSVKIYDCFAQPYTYETVLRKLREDNPIVVGINCYTTNCFAVFKLCDCIKKALPEIIIVLGGPHPSCAYEHTARNCQSFDFLIVGQGEVPFVNLLAHPKEGGLGCLNREQVLCNKEIRPFGLPVGYTALPMPAYHLIDAKLYFSIENQAFIASSRGCRYDCAFCCSKSIFNGCTEYRSSAQVLEEIDFLYNRYHIKQFYFYDDNILCWGDLQRFGKQMYDRGFTWTAQATVRDVTENTIHTLKNSGCKRLSIGFESGSLRIQKNIGKIIPNDSEDRVRSLVEAGIAVRGYFMIGFPNETEEEVLDTIRMICTMRNAGMSDLCIFPVRPYPGTRLYNYCCQQFGEADLDRFIYLDDYLEETDSFVRSKLKAYNTIGLKQICASFSPMQIRGLIRGAYHLFLQLPNNEQEMKDILLRYTKNTDII